MKNMWLATGRALRGVSTPETFELLEQFRANVIYRDLIFVSGVLEALRGRLASPGKVCLAPPAAASRPLPPLPPARPQPCDTRPSASMSLAGIVEVEVNCEKVRSEFTIGVPESGLPAGQVAVEEKTLTGESTYYFGAQVETPGSVNIEASAGSFIKTDAAGEVVDGGWYQTRAVNTPFGKRELGIEVAVSGVEVTWNTGTGAQVEGTGGLLKTGDSIHIDWPK